MTRTADTVWTWCRPLVERRRPDRAFVLGIQGPQGCGKSTAAGAVVEAAGAEGLRAICVSIDDFYLTYAEQQALAARHRDNPYLLYRGYPGTHDVALGSRILDELAAADARTEVVVPAYDKSARGGRGDRFPRSKWRRVLRPVDLVVVEGWMLGFSPADPTAIEPALGPPNAYLAAYRAWTERVDALAHLDAPSLSTIVDWRIDAERTRRVHGEAALSDDEAADYIRRFLPAYRIYVPPMRQHPPCARFLTLRLRADREPL